MYYLDFTLDFTINILMVDVELNFSLWHEFETQLELKSDNLDDCWISSYTGL